MKVANGTIQLLFVKVGGKIITHPMLMTIHSVNRLDGNGKQERKRKNRCNENFECFLFKHSLSLKLN